MRLMGGENPIKNEEFREYNQRYRRMFFKKIRGNPYGSLVVKPYDYVRFHAYNPNRPILIRRWSGVELSIGVSVKYTDDISLNIDDWIYKIKLGEVVKMYNWELLE